MIPALYPALGVDVVDIQDFAATLQRSRRRFIDEVFTEREIAYCHGRRPQHYGARWAAKEAFYKATGGALPKEVRYRDIEVVTDAAGAPSLELCGAAARWARETGVIATALSLSHSRRIACAAVLLHFRRGAGTEHA